MSKKPPYPRWKSWLSHISDQYLDHIEGEYGDELSVLLRKGKLILQANGAIYSWEDNYYNFREACSLLRWDQLPGKDCLLLGLGLGSVPQIIEEQLGQELNYTAIEYDSAVVELAEDYLLYRLRSPITVIIADAEAFVELDEESYDLILVDLFIDDQVPEAVSVPGFAEALARRLNPGGVIISNRLAYRPADREEALKYYRDVWRQVFPKGGYLDVQSNLMLFSDVALATTELELD